MAGDWKWHGENERESIVVPAVQAIAVYTNPAGDIVIRQEDPMGNEDSVVVLPRGSVNALIKAMKAEAAKKFEPDPN